MAHFVERCVRHFRILVRWFKRKNVLDYIVGRKACVCTGTGK